MHYVQAGQDPGRPAVLLIHSLGSSWLTWQLNIQPLARSGYTVIALDLPGHGYSDNPQGLDYHPAGGAEMVFKFLQALDIPRAHLVGNSAGGLIAALVALDHPQIVDRLVLVSAGGLGREVSWPLRLVSLPLAGELVYRLRLIERYDVRNSIFYRHSPFLDQMWPEMQRVNGLPSVRQATLRGIRSSINLFGQKRERLILTRLKALKAPVMTIWGEQDRIIPVSHANALRQILPQSPVHVISDCGHWPQMEQADIFNELLIQFLGDSGPPPTQGPLS
ncbi:MAG: hypothetical protein BZY80_00250 [SAR202 cluster bacterium Io17-Chloro-G2]|nr:MAG: hypothetical protein BZY80_00250 [SAR202 cluster bacterium Io17-Chloro-G2]